MQDVTFKDQRLEEAITQLQELKSRRRDIVLPIDRMRMNNTGKVVIDGLRVEGEHSENSHPFRTQVVTSLNDVAHGHVADKLKIPFKYWMRMVETNPILAAENFNSWLAWEKENRPGGTRKVFMRSYMDEVGGNIGVMRALLSDRYLPIDNLSLLAIALKAIKEEGEKRSLEIAVDTMSLTEKKFYVRFYCPSVGRESKELLGRFRDPNAGRFGGTGRDNGIISGFSLSNSEVGYGTLTLAARVLIAACSNGMVFGDDSFARKHLGGKMDEGQYREDTHRANVALIEKQLRDTIGRYLSPEFLGQRVSELEEMNQRRLLYPLQAAKNVGQEIGMDDAEIEGMLDAFVRSGATETAFDIAQAITSYAHHASPDRRYDLECASTQVLKHINKADRPITIASTYN